MATNGFEQSLRDAERAIRNIQSDSTLWVDDIRQSAEKRLGIPAGDLRALEDPTYDRALRLHPRLKRLVEEIAAVAAEYRAVVKQNEEA